MSIARRGVRYFVIPLVAMTAGCLDSCPSDFYTLRGTCSGAVVEGVVTEASLGLHEDDTPLWTFKPVSNAFADGGVLDARTTADGGLLLTGLKLGTTSLVVAAAGASGPITVRFPVEVVTPGAWEQRADAGCRLDLRGSVAP